MNNIITIAKNTFREAIRDKILYSILGFAILFIVSTIYLGTISLGEDLKIIRDFGLAGIYIFSLIIAVFIGTSLVYKEIEKRTLFITLSKPVSKIQFILGKYFGLLLGMILVVSLMAAVYLAIIALKGGGFDWRGLVAISLSLIEISLFIALSTLFSTFSAPLASTIYSVIFLYIGHSLNLVLKYFAKTGGVGLYIFKAIYYLFPNLEKFNLRNLVVHDAVFKGSEIGFSILYGLIYSAFLLILAIWSLRKQEF